MDSNINSGEREVNSQMLYSGVMRDAEVKTILLVEDNRINRAILAKILSCDYIVLQAANGLEALDILRKSEKEIHAIILDLVMPVMDGFVFLKVISDLKTYKNLPIIVSTESDSEDHETKALELGAWDFISKPYNPRILKFRLNNAIVRSQLSAFHQLKYLSEHDTLTGLYNKSKFFADTKDLLEKNPDNKFALVRFDIDRFQMVNSFFGTVEGDRLLKYIANEFKKIFGKFNPHTYGRMEADVFACCLTYDSKITLKETLANAKSIIKKYNLSFDIVPSFGIYYLDDLSVPINIMLDSATLAAKSRKGSYIDIIGEYTPEMSKSIVQEQRIVNEMSEALLQEQFQIYIQPKYSLATNTPSGGEALVRWMHPEKGIVSPAIFIPIFEKNGFISKLDFYVWEKTCKLIRKWLDLGQDPLPISVNVSRVNLYNPQIVEIIIGLINKYAIPTKLLELELTESAYTDNPQVMKHVVDGLREKGFIVLMDDFGTGYSSLSILKDIEVDSLKIDMHFLEGSDMSGRGENILASVVRMAKWLNIPTIAEGAETADQVEFLRSIGCEYVQGYYFAKPMPILEYEKLSKSKVVNIDNHREEVMDLDSLWSSNPQMEILFSNSEHATCLYEVDKNNLEILRSNKIFHNVFDMENKRPRESILPEFTKAVDAAFKKCIDLKSCVECSYRRNATENKVIWVNLKLQYICQIGGKHILFGTLFDINFQKIIEEELQKNKRDAEKGLLSNNMLIVDDSAVNRTILRSVFQNRFNVIEAENGKIAISIIKEYNNMIDIILLDLVMPNMDGMAFLEYKQTNAEIYDIPVIVVTTSAAPETQLRALALGACDFTIKPFVPEVLMRRVENVLASSRLTRYKKE